VSSAPGAHVSNSLEKSRLASTTPWSLMIMDGPAGFFVFFLNFTTTQALFSVCHIHETCHNPVFN
jgi:hypothetical protein